MTAGRKTKYTIKLHKQIVDLIATGNTIKDTCAYVGISDETYRQWTLNRLDFMADIERAKGQAHIAAVFTIRSAIQGQQETSTITETFSETRIGKNGEPYEYVRKTTRHTTTNIPPDWRAAIDYLKRRDPEHWSDKLNVKQEDWRTEVLKLVQEGKVSWEQVREELGNELTQDLFKRVGLPVVTNGTGGQ